MKSFQELTLSQPLMKAIAELGFTSPTPIQAAAIPLALTKRDLIGCAQTGSGKTVAFVLPGLEKILSNQKKQKLLILTPTRELAEQIMGVVKDLTKFTPEIRSACLIGGAGMGYQIRSLQRNPSVVVATPGRLMDHEERRNIRLSEFETVVLDEADRMLDMGFAPQVERILTQLPKERHTLLFSATLAPEIQKLAHKFMTNPEKINVETADRPAPQIKQSHIELNGADKNQRILEELATRTGQVIVFARTKQRTDKLAGFLKRNEVKAAAIHGGRTQSQRQHALNGFREGKYHVLVATDVASRGIDIPNIELVINFDLPQTSEDYTHRIGRTARAGAKGEALSFVTPEELYHWKSLTRKKSEGGHHQGQRDSNKPRGNRFSRFFKRGGRNTQNSRSHSSEGRGRQFSGGRSFSSR